MSRSLGGPRAPAVLFALSGASYIVRALMDLGSPTYYDPVTLLDYAAVVTTTVAMLTLAASIASLAIRQVLHGASSKIAWIPTAALGIGGVSNLFEDAFAVSAIGFLFGVGSVLTLLGLAALAVSTLLDRRNDRRIGAVLALMTASIFLPGTLATAGVGVTCLAMAAVLWTSHARAGRARSEEFEGSSPG